MAAGTGPRTCTSEQLRRISLSPPLHPLVSSVPLVTKLSGSNIWLYKRSHLLEAQPTEPSSRRRDAKMSIVKNEALLKRRRCNGLGYNRLDLLVEM